MVIQECPQKWKGECLQVLILTNQRDDFDADCVPTPQDLMHVWGAGWWHVWWGSGWLILVTFDTSHSPFPLYVFLFVFITILCIINNYPTHLLRLCRLKKGNLK